MTSWASVENKPKKAKRGKTWDVDADKADAIFDQFSRYDRPKSRFVDLDAPVGKTLDLSYRVIDAADVSRLTAAATMVQTFVDALSGEQSNYTVSINDHATTAVTDLRNRVMRLPAKTILDPTITDHEAALLMVAFLGHEIGHVRLDNTIDEALRSDVTIEDRGLFNTLSTILREARVESGFSELFPGYSGLFEPMLRWISRETKDGSVPPTDALGFAIAATRYPFRFDWSKAEHKAEAEWWVQWVEDYSRVEDYPSHKTALDLAYDHIKATLPQEAKQDDEQDADGDGTAMTGEGEGQSGGGTAMTGEGEGQSGGQGPSGESPSGQGGGGGSTGDYSEAPYTTAAAARQTPNQLAAAKNQIKQDSWQKSNALRQEARDGGDWDEAYVKIQEIEKQAKAAQAALTRNKNAEDKKSASIPASIEQVDTKPVSRSARLKQQRSADPNVAAATAKANRDMGLLHDGSPIRAAHETEPQPRVRASVNSDPDATGIFRSTFIRLRGGHDGRIGGKRSGRLDDRRIFRLADKRDDRVFTRRGAAKTQRLRAYLMVDTSASMSGDPEVQIRGVAKSLIEASFGADNLTLEVWGWDNTVAPVWSRGMDPDEVLRLKARGGTNDAPSLKFAVERMQKNLQQDEHGLIIMMSDGHGMGDEYLKIQVEKARSLGMSVFGVSIGMDLDQTEAYGKAGFVKWQGSVALTAQPLAKIISQSWLTKDQHRG